MKLSSPLCTVQAVNSYLVTHDHMFLKPTQFIKGWAKNQQMMRIYPGSVPSLGHAPCAPQKLYDYCVHCDKHTRV